jgi:hypothetical protein
MPETTPPQPSPDAIDLTDLTDLTELADPVAAVVAVEMTTSFVRLCLCQTEPMVARLACNEATLRKPGGLELEKRTLSKELYRLIDRTVFRQLSAAVPLSHAEFALSRVETMLREQFAEIAGTAASYLLTDDRDTAIQMAAVAITMAAREVRAQVADVIAATRQRDEPEDEEA